MKRASNGGRPVGPDISRRVFIVHGRDGVMTKRFFDLLSRVKLDPLEWETLVEASGSTSPYLGQVVAIAPHQAQATLVLLSADDVVELHSDLRLPGDMQHERARSGQGLALTAYPERTIVVEIGELRPVADLAGLNVIRFDGSSVAIKKVLDRLEHAGCPVDWTGDHWLDESRFRGLVAFQRSPETHRGKHVKGSEEKSSDRSD